MPGGGTVQLQGFAWPGPFDPTQLFPLPSGALPAVRRWVEIQWLDPHGTAVAPDSKHKVSQLTLEHEEPVPYFDTIVSRKASVDISGVGGSAVIPIEIVWLSLKSTAPIDIGLGLCDLYVGLHPGGQTEGKTKLVSAEECGNSGTMDIGLKGVTSDNPGDPDFLGLPVMYDVDFIPVGMEPIASNVVYSLEGLQAIFHGDTMSPSGQYTVIKPVPEPSALILALSGYGLVFRRRLFRRRDG